MKRDWEDSLDSGLWENVLSEDNWLYTGPANSPSSRYLMSLEPITEGYWGMRRGRPSSTDSEHKGEEQTCIHPGTQHLSAAIH